MKLPRVWPFVFLISLALAMRAAEEVPPAQLGFDPARLARLDAVIQGQVDQHALAGAVLYVARDGQPVRFRGYGMQDIESAKPMPTDAIFRIASMSKAVTTIAVMMLYEEGKFLLHDPVAKYIPEFANSFVAVPPTAERLAAPGKKYALEPAKRPIQIRDLLTHTAGLTYGDGLAIDDLIRSRRCAASSKSRSFAALCISCSSLLISFSSSLIDP